MDQFARIVVGYHGGTEEFARELLLGNLPISAWRPSTNAWDWLGRGIYLWEHSPERALRWARERYRTGGQAASVIGAVVQLGRCFDLLNETFTAILAESDHELARTFAEQGRSLPRNRVRQAKRRVLDCLVINDCHAANASKARGTIGGRCLISRRACGKDRLASSRASGGSGPGRAIAARAGPGQWRSQPAARTDRTTAAVGRGRAISSG